MKLLRSILLLPLLIPLFPGPFGAAQAQGSLLITGHDADSHHMMYPKGEHLGTEQFITAGLDFLVFGQKASPEQIGKRAAVRIAYIDESLADVKGWGDYSFKFVSGYANPTVFKLREPGWKRTLDSGAFDVVILGYSFNFTDEPFLRMMVDLVGAKNDFKAYLNRGGNLFVMVQGNYGFLPTFGAAVDDFGSESGQFYVTPAGARIGLEDRMVNGDPTHQQFKNVDTSLFTVFERSRIRSADGQVNLPLTIGFRGTLDTTFIPETVDTVQRPRSTVPSGTFTDSVCVEFFTPTDSATLTYSLNGILTSASPTLINHGRLCFQGTTTVRLIGKRTRWKDSPDTAFTYTLNARAPSTLALFSGGREITSVTAGDSPLEARLTRPDGLPCAGCTVKATPSSGGDAESLPLTAQGGGLHAVFARSESLTPVPGDGTLQHKAFDSLILTWINPLDAKDVVRRSYPYQPKPPVIPLRPSLSLFYRGLEVTTVDVSQQDLDIRLTLDSTEACASCAVMVFPSRGADTETVILAGAGSPFQGSFKRELRPGAIRGDGTLQHGRQDSIVISYLNPLEPSQVVRRSYLFLPARDTVGIRPQNTIARTAGQPNARGAQWILSDAPGLGIGKAGDKGACCLVSGTPVDARNPDSLGLVGLVIEASHGFTVDAKVFSNLGEAVSRVAFTVQENEFNRLTAVEGKQTRYLRLLWNGRTREGTRAGNGVYFLKASIALLPMPGMDAIPGVATSSRRVGILRTRD